ncbi:MAG: fibrillarin-like rRNA/tRNA 2'-O-methyltransferase [Candidatus Methanomethyliaceae archaeon]|nr:fibrillarin-like rRNA/tRNA 2'-O-methyltransferase [Candidatus Methanomethyliaceae archaeon]MDW7970898.1 fibrillarin-like rRNA/tRNA 2'-O-methyltransferase [Nitrososphaerota archaeon]
MINIKPHPKFSNIYIVEDEEAERLATKNLVPGIKIYGEQLYKFKDDEYRAWDPFRSKLAASIEKGISDVPIKEGTRILYLGAASGTTSSHVSDIIGEKGKVFCVEFSPRVMKELIEVTSRRKNMIPILADARKPSAYRTFVETVDVIYCDIAQPDQANILVDNAEFYLRKKGKVMIAIKARSIDVTKDPTEVFKKEIKVMEDGGIKILDVKRLDPFDKDHAMVLGEFI